MKLSRVNAYEKNGLRSVESLKGPPMYGDRGISDVRTVSGEFLLSLQSLWRQRGDEILHRVADHYPELIFSGMIKLAKVTRIEVDSPGDFARLGSKEAIVQKLEEKAGPEARKLFEKFVRDVEKLQAQQEQKGG
jgi:hypothetical protein